MKEVKALITFAHNSFRTCAQDPVPGSSDKVYSCHMYFTGNNEDRWLKEGRNRKKFFLEINTGGPDGLETDWEHDHQHYRMYYFQSSLIVFVLFNQECFTDCVHFINTKKYRSAMRV